MIYLHRHLSFQEFQLKCATLSIAAEFWTLLRIYCHVPSGSQSVTVLSLGLQFDVLQSLNATSLGKFAFVGKFLSVTVKIFTSEGQLAPHPNHQPGAL